MDFESVVRVFVVDRMCLVLVWCQLIVGCVAVFLWFRYWFCIAVVDDFHLVLQRFVLLDWQFDVLLLINLGFD